MGYSRRKWLVVKGDGSIETIEAETIDEVINEINEAPSRVIINYTNGILLMEN